MFSCQYFKHLLFLIKKKNSFYFKLHKLCWFVVSISLCLYLAAPCILHVYLVRLIQSLLIYLLYVLIKKKKVVLPLVFVP